MAEIILSQEEANALIAIEKHRTDETVWDYPDCGRAVSVPLVSSNRREEFLLDLRRGRIDLAKGTYQNRSRQVVILVRLDFGGSPHRNPDGEEIASPHLHVYREGYGDKWAIPLPPGDFQDPTNNWQMLDDFMKYCSIVAPPNIRRGLFS